MSNLSLNLGKDVASRRDHSTPAFGAIGNYPALIP